MYVCYNKQSIAVYYKKRVGIVKPIFFKIILFAGHFFAFFDIVLRAGQNPLADRTHPACSPGLETKYSNVKFDK